MKKKSFYNNYYGGFYSKSGKRLAEGDIVLNADGDIVNKATGDIVFNAEGDIVQSASGDIVFNAKGDINDAKGDIVKNAWGEEEYKDYADYMMHDSGEIAPGTLDMYGDAINKSVANDEDKKPKKWFDFADNIFGLAERAVTMKTKWEGGGTVKEGGVEFDYQPGSAAPKDNTMWYVIGGVLVLVVIVGFALKAKK